MVAYGAPWCPWSRRMEPVWKALHMTVLTSPLHEMVSGVEGGGCREEGVGRRV